jgi:predicted nucleic acid-binding protein
MKAADRRATLTFVLDASLTLTWAFPDEWHVMAQRAREILESRGGKAIVPRIWWYEVRNILIVNERRGRITPAGTAIFLKQIADLPIETAPAPDERILLDLARQTKLTVYDAAYLALAIEEKLPIATLDQALQNAAISMNVQRLT